MQLLLLLILGLLGMNCAVWANEIDDILKQTAPPARFVGHVPNFSSTTGKLLVDPHDKEGIREDTAYIIKDGDRVVAFVSPLTERYQLISNDPAQTWTAFTPPARYHFATLVSASPSSHVWGSPVGGKNERVTREVTGGGAIIAYIETHTWDVVDGTKSARGEYVLGFNEVTG
ncbi:MAG: hypothetical protein WCJ56_07880, partial [bacterium]